MSTRRLRRLLAALAAIPVILAVMTGISVVGAVTTPGNVPFKAKWADWLRAHHAGFVVNPLERWYYSSQAPAPGGRPHSLNPIPAPIGASGARSAAVALPPPASVPSVVSPALPGEGQWSPTGPVIGGRPAMFIAQFRADSIYTSQITTAVWIDPARLRLRLVPGTQEPGGAWSVPPSLSGPALANAVAAFNGRFRLQDAQGGFYLDGRTVRVLRVGAASAVIYDNGRMGIGAWGSGVSMTRHVQAVLQNLVLLVDKGRISPGVSYNDTSVWGNTLGATTVVARSGLGITPDGALIYVAGPALTVRSLAESLQRAGCVRAMTLDINPEWVTFNLYQHPDRAAPTQVTGAKLYPQMQRPATRYLGPTREARDFFSVSTS